MLTCNAKTEYNKSNLDTARKLLLVYADTLPQYCRLAVVAVAKKYGVHWYDFNSTDPLIKGALKLDTDSKGSTCIRLHVSKELKKHIITRGEKLADYDEYEKLCEELGNKGDVCEYLLFRRFNVEWHRTNRPYWEAPDIKTKYGDYQVKSHKSHILSERELEGLTLSVSLATLEKVERFFESIQK